jgi:hypothetical protein
VLLALLGVSILIGIFWWKGGHIPPGSAAVVMVVGALPLAQRWWESVQVPAPAGQRGRRRAAQRRGGGLPPRLTGRAGLRSRW